MAALKTNKMIPAMVIAFVAMAGMVFYKASRPNGAKPVMVESGQWMRKAPTPHSKDADTSNDTIRAIRGEVTAARSNADETLAMNLSLIERLDEAKIEKIELEEKQESYVEKELQAQSVQNQRQFDLMMGRMAEMVEQIGKVERPRAPVVIAQQTPGNTGGDSEIAIPDGFGVNIEAGQFVSGEDLIEVFWIEPLDESINNRVRGPAGIRVKETVAATREVATAENAKALLMKPLDTYRDLVDTAAEGGKGVVGKVGELAK